MSVRTATKEDVPHIALLVHSLAHYYLDGAIRELPSWFAETLTLSAIAERVSDSEYLILVYEIDGSIVGYLAIKGGSHLYHLFVSEAHQGKGIAKQLWIAAIEGSPVKCFTLRSSLYAVPVYKRFGFEESGSIGSKDGMSFQPMELNRAV